MFVTILAHCCASVYRRLNPIVTNTPARLPHRGPRSAPVPYRHSAMPDFLLTRVAHLLSALLLTIILSSSASSQSERKIASGILIDNTGSLRSQFDQVIKLSKGIVGQTYQRGPISLFVFKPEGDKSNRLAVVASDIQWSQDQHVLDKYLDSVFVVPGQTTLMDGINAIAMQLNAKASLDKDAIADKVLFLITDGEDRSSKIREKELIKTLKESGIKVYAVGLVRELDNEGGLIRKPARQKAVAFLEWITKETGGRVVFPKSKNVDVDTLLNELLTK